MVIMRNGVKIVAISDLHEQCNIEKMEKGIEAKRPDIVVVAGDIQGSGGKFGGRLYWAYEFSPFLRRLEERHIDVVVIPGNHDFWLHEASTAENLHMGRVNPNLHLVDGLTRTVKGVSFWGTSWVPFINGQWKGETSENELKSIYAGMPLGVDVVVSHGPPLGIGDDNFDVSMQFKPQYRKHFGSSALRDEVLKKKPKLVICGHIHSGDHAPYKIGDTTVVNVSLIDERYKPAYGLTQVFCQYGKELKITRGRKWYARSATHG